MRAQRTLSLFVILVVQSPGGLAQNGEQGNYDPRDLSGVWYGSCGGGGDGPGDRAAPVGIVVVTSCRRRVPSIPREHEDER